MKKTLYININGERIDSTEELKTIGRPDNSIKDVFFYELGKSILEGVVFPSGYKANKTRLITDFRSYDPESFHSILDQWDNLKLNLFNLKLEEKCEIILPQKYIEWLNNNREPSYAIIARHLYERRGSVCISIEDLFLNSIDILLDNINADDYSSFVINDESVTEESGIVGIIQDRIGNVPFEAYNEWKDRYFYKVPKELLVSEEDKKIYQFIELLVNTNCLQVETEGDIERLIMYIPAVPELQKISSYKPNMTQEKMNGLSESFKVLMDKNFLIPDKDNAYVFNWDTFFASKPVYPKKKNWPSNKWINYLRTYWFKIINNYVCSPIIPNIFCEPSGLKDNWERFDFSALLLDFLDGVHKGKNLSDNIFEIKSEDNLSGLAYDIPSFSKSGLIIVPSFICISKLYEGRMVVKGTNGLYGYINVKGEIVIPCRYTRAHRFVNGRARVWIGGEERFINQDGESESDNSIASETSSNISQELNGRNIGTQKIHSALTNALNKLHESVYVLQEECSDFFSNDTEDIFDDKDQQGNFIKNYFVINGITLGQTTKREIINWGGLQRFSFPGTYKMRDGTCCNFHSDSEIVNNIFLESGERTDDRNVNKVHLPDFSFLPQNGRKNHGSYF